MRKLTFTTPISWPLDFNFVKPYTHPSNTHIIVIIAENPAVLCEIGDKHCIIKGELKNLSITQEQDNLDELEKKIVSKIFSDARPKIRSKIHKAIEANKHILDFYEKLKVLEKDNELLIKNTHIFDGGKLIIKPNQNNCI